MSLEMVLMKVVTERIVTSSSQQEWLLYPGQKFTSLGMDYSSGIHS